MTLDDINMVHHFAGGVYAKQTRIPAGVALEQHVHNYAHLSILASGTVLVQRGPGGGIEQHTGPCAIHIPAGVMHTVQAVDAAVWFCVHATAETDPAKVDATLMVPA
jgi:quercetin dioxygenase-like cupin family protein